MDRDRLAKLRKKKADAKAQDHQQLIESNASVREAIVALHKSINGQEKFDASTIINQIKALGDNLTFKDEIKSLTNALAKQDKQPLEIKNFQDLLNASDTSNIANAVNNLIEKLDDNSIDQKPKDFQPIRRVVKIGNRLVFDDVMTPSNVGGVSTGGGAAVQMPLVRDTDDGQAIAIVNPDGSSVGGSGGGLVPEPYDEIQATYPTTSSEVYTYKLAGDTVAVVTVTYTDASKEVLTSVVRS